MLGCVLSLAKKEGRDVSKQAQSRFEDQFQLRDAAQILDVPGHRIKNWAFQRVIAPTGSPSGTGTRRLYTAGDLAAIGLVDHCRTVFGRWIRPKVIGRRIQRAIREAALGDRAEIPNDLVIVLYHVPKGTKKAGNVLAQIVSLGQVQPIISELTHAYGRVPVYTIFGLGAVLSQIQKKM